MSPGTDLPSDRPYGPPRWSAMAIAAFVCAILGFLGFTAILGLIFAVAGIVVTRKGERRGLGLAVAAIPISILTGAIGLFLAYGVLTATSMFNASEAFHQVMSKPSDQIPAEADKVYEITSKSFQQDISREQFVQWLQQISAKHGNMVGLERDPDLRPVTSGPRGTAVNVRAKFTNGPVLVRIMFMPKSLMEWKIEDIEVDGDSVRPETAESEE